MHEGLSAAQQGGNKVHITDSNLLETKAFKAYGICAITQGSPFFYSISVFCLNKQPKTPSALKGY